MPLKDRSSYEVFRSVVFALIVREMKTRFGKWRLGYFWAILEPLISILAITVVVKFIRGRNPWFGIPVPVFVTSGYVIFQFFRTLSTHAVNSISSNRGLFGYRQVKPFDTIVSRAILETLIFITVVLCVSFIGYWIFDYEVAPYDPIRAGIVIILLILFSFGLGLVFAVWGALNPEATKLIPVLNRPLLFISCVMYPLVSVPEHVRNWLLWNPILHAIEQFRYSLFRDYPGYDTSIIYLAKCTLVSVAFGLILYTSKRHKLVAT